MKNINQKTGKVVIIRTSLVIQRIKTYDAYTTITLNLMSSF